MDYVNVDSDGSGVHTQERELKNVVEEELNEESDV